MKKIVFVLCTFALVLSQDKCHDKSSCRECIQVPGCAWDLSDNIYNGIRCLQNTSSHSDLSQVYNPDNFVTITRDSKEFQIKLRLLTPLSIRVKFQNEEDNSLQVPNLEISQIQIHIKTNGSLNSVLTIEATECSKDPAQNHQQINLISQKTNHTVILDLEFLCSCACEEAPVLKSPLCFSSGTYKCGICECQNGRSGRRCECIGTEDPNQCIHNGTECSNRGICICGVCECLKLMDSEERIYGEYCECDNYSCPRVNRKLCGGPNQGTCQCGMCECRYEWKGNDCNTRQNHR